MSGANSFSDALRQALGLHHAGRVAEAETVYRRILSSQPRDFHALHFLGVLRAQSGDMAEAVALIGKALEIKSDDPLAHFHLAGALLPLGRKAEALASYSRAAALKPDFAEAHSARADILLKSGRAADALDASARAIALKADGADAHLIRGNALLMLDRKAEALAAFDRIIALNPGLPEAHLGRANVLAALDRNEDALAGFDKVIALRSDYAEAYYNRANTLLTLNRAEEALAAFDSAIALKPDCVEAINNRSDVLRQSGRLDEAMSDCERAVALAPGDAPVHNNRGTTLLAMGRSAEALEAFNRALEIDPDFTQALYNRACLFAKLGRLEEAVADADRASVLDPPHDLSAGEGYFVSSLLCDWRRRAERIDDLMRRLREGRRLEPWITFTAFDDPEAHLTAARRFAEPPKRAIPRTSATHARLRIAYLSPDFCDHVVAHQVVELLEHHDKTRFETYGICFRRAPDSAIRQRLKRSFDHFVEAGALCDRDIAQLLAESHIDIAVDLGGYTEGGRTKSLAYRPAPIAVNFLGYPGSLGADYVDYIIADAQVIPQEFECFYAEKIARLPDCFFPSDTTKRGDLAPPSRAEVGLPDTGFVFCGFNNAYKITPQILDVWTRLLRAVDGSVLWLNVGNAKARINLCAEAEARGVSSGRLIFAGRVEGRAQHFDRIALADLFLDTLPYNAHATASDMLWAGVPIVTCAGRSFAARVAGSMLTAIGAEELITQDLVQYEALALDLARSPERLAAIRAKLAKNRAGHPLFDIARLCRALEAAYQTMWDLHANGRKPECFMVNSLTEPGPS